MAAAHAATDSVSYYIEQSKMLQNKGQLQDALGMALRGLSEAEKSGNELALLKANMQVGNMYYYNDQANKKKILPYYFAAKNIAERNGMDSARGHIYHNIGVCFTEDKKYDSAIYYMQQSITIMQHLHNYRRLAKSYAVLSELYKQRPETRSSILPTIRRAYEFALLSNDTAEIAFAEMKYGFYFADGKQYDSALVYFNKSLELALIKKDLEGQSYALRNIANALARRDAPHIGKAFDAYIRAHDSLFQLNAADKASKYEVLYETEKKERQNRELQQQNALKQEQVQARNYLIGGLTVVLLLAGALIMWRLNVLRLRREQAELMAIRKLEQERSRISRDLHDNVGALVSFVNTKINWISRNREVNGELAADLELVGQNAREILQSLRESIWTLNASNITTFELTDKIKNALRSQCIVPFSVQDELTNEFVLPNEQVLAIYRSCQEIINNINKHSGAAKVEARFSHENNARLCIIISDNGVGVSSSDLEKTGHYGLRNIRSRLAEWQIGVTLETAAGHGTTVKITV